MSDFDHFCINAKQYNVFLLYNFEIIFYDKHFEKTQVKHNCIHFFFSKQNAMIVLLLTYYLSLCLNHGDLTNMLQKVISKLIL